MGEVDRIVALARGDREALVALLERHGPAVHARISARIPERYASLVVADDVMQVTYLEAFLRMQQFAGNSEAAFHRWLESMADHNRIDALRELSRTKRPEAHGRAPSSGEGHSELDLLDRLGFESRTPSRDVARAEASALLGEALSRLPADYAAVIRAYDLEQRPVAEVATRLQRSRGAVHMLRLRAHERLREVLGSESRFFSKRRG